ncbi:MAG: ribonuclease R, partial [Flavisolibacter sp.]
MGRKHQKKPGKKRQRSFDEYKGVLEITRSGMGFVVVPDLETDILVRPNDFNTAMNGDTVRVEVNPERTGKRMQGAVIDILERKQMEFVGRLQMNKGFAFAVIEGDKKVPDIFIPSSSFNGAKNDDRVVVRIKEWEKDSGKRPVGEVINVLNAEDANDIAMKQILLENG